MDSPTADSSPAAPAASDAPVVADAAPVVAASPAEVAAVPADAPAPAAEAPAAAVVPPVAAPAASLPAVGSKTFDDAHIAVIKEILGVDEVTPQNVLAWMEARGVELASAREHIERRAQNGDNVAQDWLRANPPGHRRPNPFL